MSGTLFVVGTPIGNLGDFSPRAVEILKEVDFIAAEDTRVTIKLLNHFSISTPMISYFAHNIGERGPQIIERLLGGEDCAIVTDAGMPCISDPGEELVRLAMEHGIATHSVPGPTAALTALALSGQNTSRFSFEGFISVNASSRKEHLESIVTYPNTLIFYEAPHKLRKTLRDLYQALGNRSITLCRELTKIHEEVWKTTLEEATNHYRNQEPRGEFVLVVEGYQAPPMEEISLEQAVQMVLKHMEEGNPLKEAAKIVAKETPFSKSELYKATMETEKP